MNKPRKPRTKRMDKIISFLGRKPKDNKEYQTAWKFLFEKDNREQREVLRIQRRRHLSHTGVANVTRKYCYFCEQRKLGK